MTHGGLQEDLVAVLAGYAPSDDLQRSERESWMALAEDQIHLTRSGSPAHFTTSALPVSEDGSQVCLVLHAKLGLWVQPGGHFEPADASVAAAAGREMHEETGLSGDVDPKPVLLSRHPAPCGTGDWHLDVQSVATVRLRPAVVSSESFDVAWFAVSELPSQLASGVRSLVRAAVGRVSRSSPPAATWRLE